MTTSEELPDGVAGGVKTTRLPPAQALVQPGLVDQICAQFPVPDRRKNLTVVDPAGIGIARSGIVTVAIAAAPAAIDVPLRLNPYPSIGSVDAATRGVLAAMATTGTAHALAVSTLLREISLISRA